MDVYVVSYFEAMDTCHVGAFASRDRAENAAVAELVERFGVTREDLKRIPAPWGCCYEFGDEAFTEIERMRVSE